MWGLAVAAGTPSPRTNRQSPAAAARPAAETRQGLHTDRRPSQHAPEPVLERDLRFPAEQLPCTGDVGLANLGVVDRQRLEHDLAARAGDHEHGLRQLEDGELPRVADVDGEVLAALR